MVVGDNQAVFRHKRPAGADPHDRLAQPAAGRVVDIFRFKFESGVGVPLERDFVNAVQRPHPFIGLDCSGKEYSN